jgi:hypothetical protein
MRDCRTGREIIVIWAMSSTDGFDIACLKRRVVIGKLTESQCGPMGSRAVDANIRSWRYRRTIIGGY